MKRKIVACVCLITFVVGCSWMADLLSVPIHGSPEVKGRKDQDIPPTKKKQLLRWLKAGNYRETYSAESEVHESTGPHGGNVRTYYNSVLVGDLKDGKTVFSKGAAMVKELYFDGKEEVIGYAVMIKVRKNSGNSGQGWLFYESFDGTNKDAIFGRGLSECADCHSVGVDFLRSSFRP